MPSDWGKVLFQKSENKLDTKSWKAHPHSKASQPGPLEDSHDVGFVHSRDVAPVVVASILKGKLSNALARFFCDEFDALHNSINDLKGRRPCCVGRGVATLWYQSGSLYRAHCMEP